MEIWEGRLSWKELWTEPTTQSPEQQNYVLYLINKKNMVNVALPLINTKSNNFSLMKDLLP